MSQSEKQHSSTGNDAARTETVVDVGTQRVARIYAEAVLGAAEKQKQSGEILEELEALTQQVFRADPHFQAFLASSAMGRERKAHVIRKAFENRASELLVNFLLVLNEHERLDLLQPITTAYRDLRDERGGRVRVQVSTAVPLPDDQRERLRQQLAESLHKDPVLELQIDPELLGGMVVRVNDWLYDYSVRAQLEDIRKQILVRSSYEIQSRRDRFSSPDGN